MAREGLGGSEFDKRPVKYEDFNLCGFIEAT